MKTKFNGILTLLLAFVVQFSFAQERAISGNISDADGALPGVSVIIKGTTSGVESDFDGNYVIQAKTGDVLQYNFVGYTDVEKTVGSDTTINVVMADGGTIETVVIKTLGRKFEPRSSTVALETVGGDDFQDARESNVVNSLSGKVAGVQVTSSSGNVGSSSRVVLRGASSLTGNNQPLYVIDGVPIDNTNRGDSGAYGGVDTPTGIADISPDDIESVTVLKGPAAAAMYGVRASNGVIVVKTKSGKLNDRLGIEINSSISFQNPLLLPNYQNSYGQGGNSDYFEWIDGTNGDGGTDESWGPALDVGLEFVQWNSNGAPAPWVSQPDNVKDFFETGVTLNNNVSFSGGGEKTAYRLSVSSMNQDGMVPSTEFNRFTIGGNTSTKLGEKFNSSVSFNYSKSKSGQMPIGGYDNENPMQQFVWSGRNVDFNALRDWRNLGLAPEGTAAAGTPENWNTVFQNNPFWVLDVNKNTYNQDRIVGNIGLSYDLSEHFNITGNVGTDSYSQLQTRNKAVGSNNFPNGYYREINRKRTETNSSLIANYNDDLGESLNLDVSFGGNTAITDYKFNNQSIPQLEIPGLYNLSNLATGQVATSVGRTSQSKINSLFGVAKFGYNNNMFLEVTGRNDWSSVLPLNNNSFFYPSVTASFVLSDIFGMEDSAVDFLKIRGGWAKVGGSGILGAYDLTNTYTLNNSWGVTLASLPNSLKNPDIKPEATSGFTFGLDSRFLNSRLKFGATYYDQVSSDLIVEAQISAGSGYDRTFRNIGEMRNSGLELLFGWKIIKSEDWTVDLDLNYAKNKNEVVNIGGLESLVLGGQWSMTLEAREGHAYGDIVGTYFDRTDAGDVIYENGYPKIVSGDTKVLGNITPDWTGGANLSVGYKNITFGALVDAKIGGDIYSMTTAWGRYAGVLDETLLGRETGIVGDGVMLDTATGTYVPNNVSVDAESFNKRAFSNSIVESAVFDASYVKLRQLQLGYSIPSRLFKNTGVNALTFSVVARNVAILYKKVPHIDPETSFSDSNGNQGQEFGQLPSARSVGFNFNIKF